MEPEPKLSVGGRAMSQDARASKEHSSSSKALQDQGTAFEELSGSDARGQCKLSLELEALT